MRVLEARNVHTAFPQAVQLLMQDGVERPSRNGIVLQAPYPVTTVYTKPCERVLFWEERDANPFFHLFESLWMLAGRRDIAPLVRYVPHMATFSDDGVEQHGAYGHRWRSAFGDPMDGEGVDQLSIIAERLTKDPEDRRCVLQMWDTQYDLGRNGKDVPCNTTATFQRGWRGELDLTVFCRSNDIVWGCYGANAVHFSMLHEYMANWIGCPVGVYRQVSINWHAYLDTLKPVENIRPDRMRFIPNPYDEYYQNVTYLDPKVHHVPLPKDILKFDSMIAELLQAASTGFELPRTHNDDEPFMDVAYKLLYAHHRYKTMKAPERFGAALHVLGGSDRGADWIVAAREWVLRRELKWVRANT